MSTGNSPLVSIVTPMYNSAKFVEETIASVLAQEYNNWELILADDGSTDNTIVIAKEFAKQYPGKIKFISHKDNINKGASATRNLAISIAKGELIALIDSDDLWKPNYLKKQVEFILAHPEVEVVCEATLYWNSWSDAKAEDVVINVGAPSEQLYKPPFLAYTLYPLGEGAAPCMCGIVMRANVMKKIGGFEDVFTGNDQLFEDQAFAIKNYLHNVVYLSSRANNIYRQRPDSLMHGIIDEGLYRNGRHFFLLWLKDYLRKKNINNKHINQLLRKALLASKFPKLHNFSLRLQHKYNRLFQSAG